jgi:hypothetical protein
MLLRAPLRFGPALFKIVYTLSIKIGGAKPLRIMQPIAFCSTMGQVQNSVYFLQAFIFS